MVHNERKARDGSPVYKACKTMQQVEIAKRHGFVEAAAKPVLSIEEPKAEPKPTPKPPEKRRGRKPKDK